MPALDSSGDSDGGSHSDNSPVAKTGSLDELSSDSPFEVSSTPSESSDKVKGGEPGAKNNNSTPGETDDALAQSAHSASDEPTESKENGVKPAAATEVSSASPNQSPSKPQTDGKVKVPSWLQKRDDLAPKRTPSWMLKTKALSKNKHIGDNGETTSETKVPPPPDGSPPSPSDNSFTSSAEEIVLDTEDEEEIVVEDTDEAEYEDIVEEVEESEVEEESEEVFDVKKRIGNIHAATPKGATRKTANDQPAWLQTGAVPKASRLSEENRTIADPLVRKVSEPEPEEDVLRRSFHVRKTRNGEATNTTSNNETRPRGMPSLNEIHGAGSNDSSSVISSEAVLGQNDIEQSASASNWTPLETDRLPLSHSRAREIAANPEALAARFVPDDEDSVERETLPKSISYPDASVTVSDSDMETWLVPHRYDDDSSWVNPIREVDASRRKQVTEELKEKSVELPRGGDPRLRDVHITGLTQFNSDDNDISTIGGLSQIAEESKYGNRTVDSKYIYETSTPNQDIHSSWSLPSASNEIVYQHKLDAHKEGKDFRFSYIATTHTHSTASYSDTVRERYFPKEDNPIWEPDARKASIMLDGHLSSTPRAITESVGDEESWLPPENTEDLLSPQLPQERVQSSSVSMSTADSDWIPGSDEVSKSRRVDFAGTITGGDSERFEWNPAITDSPPDSETSGDDSASDDEEDFGSPVFVPPVTAEESEEDDSKEFHGDASSELADFSLQGRDAPAGVESAPANNDDDFENVAQRQVEPPSKGKHVETSASGRLRFNMAPETIYFDSDVEQQGNKSRGTRSKDHGMPKSDYRTRLYILLGCFLICVVPATVAVLVLVVFVDDDNGSGSGVNSTGTVFAGSPTLAPAVSPDQPSSVPSPPSPTEPIDGQPKPTPTSPVSPPPSPSRPTTGPPSFVVPTEDVLIELLSRLSLDGGAALRDTSSPQYTAMQWIRTPNNVGIYNDRIFLQRYALATLYYSTEGNNWIASDAWLTNATECEWYSSSQQPALICDADRNILELNLANNNLRGTIPAELALLAGSLGTLQLSRNSLSGDFPTALTLLSKLSVLQLAGNKIEGTLPTELGSLSQLTSFSMFENNMRSTIPATLGDLQYLEQIDLGANQLTGRIPIEMARLTNLNALTLRGNEFTGLLPPQFQSLRNLKLLYVQDTSLDPPFPSGICNLDFTEFWADCDELGGCSCCTKCCTDGEICV